MSSCNHIRLANGGERSWLQKFVHVVALIASIAVAGTWMPRTIHSAELVEATRLLQDGEFDRAIALFEEFANQGHDMSQAILGMLFYEGIFVPKNSQRARELFLKAIEGNEPEAFFYLGDMYDKGDGVPRDVEKAIHYLREASNRGHPYAQYVYGAMLVVGRDVERDLKTADTLLRNATRNGARGAVAVGIQMDLFAGEVSDWKDLVRRLSLVEKEGLALVQNSLGLAFQSGKGVPQDRVEALKWLMLADFQGLEAVAKERRQLEATLDIQDVQVAETRALDWLKENAKSPRGNFGRSSRWCVEKRQSSIECLKKAVVHHERCRPPHHPGFFEKWYVSRAYEECRTRLIA